MAGVPVPDDLEAITEVLSRAGCVAAPDEAMELLSTAKGDTRVLESLVTRRVAGEPLAWITGSVLFCDVEVGVHPGVYVPRWQSEPLVRRAVQHLPASGVAIEPCTGSGAIAKVLAMMRPHARVVATDLDEQAVTCAVANGVEAYVGDLFTPVPKNLLGGVDVVVGVVPYVPTDALSLLPRDTLVFESTLAYDGGPDGTEVLRRVASESSAYLRPGGALVLELGADQSDILRPELERMGFVDICVLFDAEGDERGIEAIVALGRAR